MKKTVSLFIVVIALILSGTIRVNAQEADVSASIKSRVETADYDYRVENLRRFLEKYNSPLAPYAEDFVASADNNGLDYRMVPAIAGVESTFGKQIPQGSYNAYGWANGDYKFESWEDSIGVVTETLRTKYVDRGAPTIAQIAKRYAPPSATWGGKVKYFVNKIDTLPVSFDI